MPAKAEEGPREAHEKQSRRVYMHAFAALHVVPIGHTPQLTVPPHPSGIVPQTCPGPHAVIFVQPQTFVVPGLPPPHVFGAVQVPQVSIPPHPSGIGPQFCPPEQTVSGAQTHMLLALQVCPAAQVPQLIIPPHPSEALPHVCVPQAAALLSG